MTGDVHTLRRNLADLTRTVSSRPEVEVCSNGTTSCENEVIVCNSKLVSDTQESVNQTEHSTAGNVSRSSLVVTPHVRDTLCREFGRPSTTLLHVAAQAGHSLAVKVLLEHGADPTIK